MVLYPYMSDHGSWVFDDPNTCLKEEAFVMGMSEIIHGCVSKKKIHAGKGFKMTFSDEPFDHDIELTWFKNGDLTYKDANDKEHTIKGNWYHTGDYFRKGPKAGWLCPALFKYFSEAPEKIYVKAEKLPPNVNPIWPVTKGFAFVLASQKMQEKLAA